MQERDDCQSFYGLSYVGLTLRAAWLRADPKNLGADILEKKVRAISNLLISHAELAVAQEMTNAVSTGNLEATLDRVYASGQSKVNMIAVPVGLDDKAFRFSKVWR
jgi:UDP-N-acetyl-D-mannosaminuronate dehydrogenase